MIAQSRFPKMAVVSEALSITCFNGSQRENDPASNRCIVDNSESMR